MRESDPRISGGGDDELTARMAHANRLIDDEPRRARGRRGHIGRLDRLCSVLTRVLPASGVGLSLLTDDNHGGTVAASDARSRNLEELQFTLGEGPCIDAYVSRRPVLEPDLDTHGARRWPGYALAAQEHGVHAVFAFPLQVGAARAGALDVYRAEAGSLSAEALTQAVTFADVAMGLLVDGQAQAGEHRASTDLDHALANRLEVYQAQGMVMVDLGVGIEEAMARLRAHAFAEGRSIGDVAQDIVAGKLVLDRDRT
ncbi:MAG TPA: GAF and ANTAR domain-containing protein [Ornithinibacter sp.]|nr:GAF and ANTAR domain-containing protein [Ornithinibacter sp.]